MPDTATLGLFLAAAAVLLLTPGPAVLYIMARSLDQGRLAGLVSMLGIAVGTVIHIIAAAFGLSALLASSAVAFAVVQYAGAAYLIVLGLRNFFAREEPQHLDAPPPQPLRRIFVQGIVVNVLNPKTALFFLAFLPQFVDRSRGPVVTQVMIFGLILIVLGMLSDSAYAMLAGSLRQFLTGSRRVLRVQRYCTGTVYLGLGVTTALARRT